MVGTNIRALSGRWVGLAAVAVTLGLGSAIQPAAAQHKSNENDMEVPTNDTQIVQQGKDKYAQRCSFCHGGDGHGGKGPCLSCGVFKYTGNTNSEIYATIAIGVPRSLGGTMGAFGTTMSQEEILSVITFLRWEEKRRIAAGDIPDPKLNKGNELPVFPTTN
ncbi:MAG TPA: c-type cytochrome [Burkholderiales bacterium]|nr:c-type cytochrome [Burkholderiales bacterium]